MSRALGSCRRPADGARTRCAQRVGDDRNKRLSATRTSIAARRSTASLDDATWKEVAPDSALHAELPRRGHGRRRSAPTCTSPTTTARSTSACAPGTPTRRGIVERLTRRDRDTDADKVEIEISSKNDRITAYHFGVNVSGVLAGRRALQRHRLLDATGTGCGSAPRTATRTAGRPSWRSRSRRCATKAAAASSASRCGGTIQRRQEVDEWAYIPRAARGEVSYYGILDGLAGLHATRLFQIVPYLAAGVYVRSNQDPASLNGTQLYGNIGADLKLGLTPALTLDATINPDFGQVEADQVVLNLSTFEVFFPEKRPFFLEGVDVFATPLSLFYSRRIGHSPPLPYGERVHALEPAAAGAHLRRGQAVGPGRAAADHRRARRGHRRVVDAGDAHRRARVSRCASRPSRSPTTPSCASSATSSSRSYVGLMATAVNRFEQPDVEAPQRGRLLPRRQPRRRRTAAARTTPTPPPSTSTCAPATATGARSARSR